MYSQHTTMGLSSNTEQPVDIELAALRDYIAVLEQDRETLRRTHRSLQRLIDALPTPVYLYDMLEQQMVCINRAAADLAGSTLDAALALDNAAIAALIHPDDHPRLSSDYERLTAAQEGEVIETEYRIQHTDGSWRWLQGQQLVFKRTADGKPQRLLGTARDISASRQQHEQLLFQEHVLSLVRDAVVALDMNYCIRYWSKGAEQLYGFRSEEVLGQTIQRVCQ